MDVCFPSNRQCCCSVDGLGSIGRPGGAPSWSSHPQQVSLPASLTRSMILLPHPAQCLPFNPCSTTEAPPPTHVSMLREDQVNTFGPSTYPFPIELSFFRGCKRLGPCLAQSGDYMDIRHCSCVGVIMVSPKTWLCLGPGSNSLSLHLSPFVTLLGGHYIVLIS